MNYIKVTKDNIEEEHICCAISNNNDVQVSSKKAWLSDRFDEGLVFLKSVERGKCFIEYIPAENAWNPIDAPGYMYIDCLWVSGSLKGHPLCVECLKAGRYVKATDVDHIKPHRGDSILFWDQRNWQPLCHRHHSIKTRNEDHTPEYRY